MQLVATAREKCVVWPGKPHNLQLDKSAFGSLSWSSLYTVGARKRSCAYYCTVKHVNKGQAPQTKAGLRSAAISITLKHYHKALDSSSEINFRVCSVTLITHEDSLAPVQGSRTSTSLILMD